MRKCFLVIGSALLLVNACVAYGQSAEAEAHAESYIKVNPIGFVEPSTRAPVALGGFKSKARFELAAGRTPRDRASFMRILAQVYLGAVGAIAAGTIAYRAFDNDKDRRTKGDESYSVKANTAYVFGSFVGSTAAVQIVGQGDGSRAPLRNTAIATGVVTLPLLMMRTEPLLPLIGILIGAPVQSMTGTIAYQMSRRPPPELPNLR